MLTLGIIPYFDACGLKITVNALYAQSSGEESDEGWDWGGSPSSPQEAAAKEGMPVLASANIDVDKVNVVSSGGGSQTTRSATYPIMLDDVNVTAYSSNMISVAEYYSLVNNLSGNFNFTANVQPFSFDGVNELKEVTITATRSDGGLSDFDYLGFLNWLHGGIQSYNDYVDVTEHIDEQPEPPTLSLRLSATKGAPADVITFIADIGGGAIETPELRYYGEFGGAETELQGVSKLFNSFEYKIQAVGKIRFRVKLSYKQNNQIGTIFSDWVEFTSEDPCNAAQNAGLKASLNNMQYLTDLKNMASTSTTEHGFRIYKDTNGEWYADINKGIVSGDDQSHTVTVPVNAITVAYVHHHTAAGLSSHSAVDIYGFAGAVTNSQLAELKAAIVVGGSEEAVYALILTDRAKVQTFLDNNPQSSNLEGASFKPGTSFRVDYDAAYDAMLGTDTSTAKKNEAHLYAMAYILSKYNMGLVLAKQASDGSFKAVSATKNANNVYNKSTCP